VVTLGLSVAVLALFLAGLAREPRLLANAVLPGLALALGRWPWPRTWPTRRAGPRTTCCSQWRLACSRWAAAARVVIVTSDFHAFLAALTARRTGLRGQATGAG
jgi:hypothetical protein